MGTVSRLPEKIRMAAPTLASEADAFNRMHDVIRQLQSLSNDDGPDSAGRVISIMKGSGLLGISVPAEAGGADVSNAALGEITMKVAAANRFAAAYIANHFYCVELLRDLPAPGPAAYFHGRALAGELFHLPDAPDGNAAALAPEPGKPGWRLNGPMEGSGDLIHADWFVVVMPSPSGGDNVAFLPRATPGLSIRRKDISFVGVHVDNDCLFEVEDLPNHTAEAVGHLLKAAERLGWAERKLNDTLAERVRSVPQPKFGQDYLSLLGLTVSRLENGKAALERAGGKVDVAQINPGDITGKSASFSASIALASAAETYDLALELHDFDPEATREGRLSGVSFGTVALGVDPYGLVPIGATILDGSLH